jgi:hypothetical protein
LILKRTHLLYKARYTHARERCNNGRKAEERKPPPTERMARKKNVGHS